MKNPEGAMEDGDCDVAVIGIGCNFPGGEGLDNFWDVLLEGRNCTVEIPAERFDAAAWYHPDENTPGKTQTTTAALIDGFNEFDHKFFGIAEAEADLMDPQQKLLLQCTYRAFEDAGMSMERLSGSRTGVYIGLMNRDYEMLRGNSPATIAHYNGTGTAMSIAANRISFTFDLTGPSLAVDSACSSSLVALHLACQAINQGDCEMALCGGVNCIIEPRVFVALSKAKMISPEGTSKPFSSRADGYGRGEGCGVVLLKPLKNALQDGDKIWGVICRTAVNQDGRSVSPITKPSRSQQEALLRRIYSDCHLTHVQYIEAHGSGTPVGDPTEAASISNVIAKARRPSSARLRVGSVKGNIGHTESAAGVAGLIKVLLMMKHQTIVPSVFYSEDSSSVDANMSGLSITTRAERWSTDGSLMRVAGINSFGFGGTNAHAIVKECRRTRAPSPVPAGSPKLFVLSAASEKSLLLSMMDTKQRLERHHSLDLQALAYTSACGRSHSRHRYRRAVLASSLSDLQDQLSSMTKPEATTSGVQLAFVFSGNGVAFRGMCQQLFRDVSAFRNKVMEVESLFQSHARISITQWLHGDGGGGGGGGGHDGDFTRPDVAQPLLFAIQVGLAAALKLWGVRPAAVLGHSAGEVAAAHCSGLLSLEDAVKVVHHRSALQSTVAGGRMLVVGNVAVEEVVKVLHVSSEKVCVAAFNSPQSCTLSGESAAIDALHHKLRTVFVDRKIFLHILDVPAAYHSHMMNPILDDVRRNLDCFAVNDVECKLYSTVTGNEREDGDFSTGGYWAKNIKEPVLFEHTLHALTKENQCRRNMVFVEIGPRRALQRNIHETLGEDVMVLSSAEPERESQTLFSTVAKLFELGVNVRWAELYQGCRTPPAPLPVYQFDNTKKDVCFEAVRRGAEASTSPRALTSEQDGKGWVCSLSRDSASFLWEHQHHGVPILPGAFYADLAYVALAARLKPKTPVSLLQLSMRFQSVLTLSSDRQQLRVSLDDTQEVFTVRSAAAVHASGTFRRLERQPVLEEANVCLDAIFQRCELVMRRAEVYSVLSQAGFRYGSVFRQLDRVHLGQEMKEAVAAVQVPSELMRDLHEHFIHPVILDYFLQMTGLLALGGPGDRRGLPSAIGSIVIAAALQQDMVMYLRATRETPDFLEVCGCFSTPEGRVLVELLHVRVTFLGSFSNITQSAFFHNEIIPLSAQRKLHKRIKALVFEDNMGIAEALRPFLHPDSTTVQRREDWVPGQLGEVVLGSLRDGVREILFFWAVEDLSHFPTEQMLESMVRCCELFRQVVVASRGSSCTVRVITYRSTETAVDRISPAFALSGMTRACAAEVTGLSFQLVDMTSTTQEDVETLVHVINTCKQQEVLVSKGKASVTKIARTPGPDRLGDSDLHLADPSRMEASSVVPGDWNQNEVPEKSVELQLANTCIHSCDYFPVSAAGLTPGSTPYWSQHASHRHQLLALDFSGVVTAVGKDVRHVRVGDHVASCYPVAASAKVVVPEAVCYDTKRLPFLRGSPCVSYFLLAWEILERTLPAVRHRRLVVIAPNLASALVKVLALTANRSGWNVSCLPRLEAEPQTFDPCQVFVFLPPFDQSWQKIPNADVQERHVVFVGGSCGSLSVSADWLASRSERTHVHKIDVFHVLQRAKLRAQSGSVREWLLSLGLDSLPLKTATFQMSAAAERRPEAGVESYFSATTVWQVAGADPPPATSTGRLFKKQAVYVVTGGLTGLGLETVKFIARNGGGCIVTLSRRTPTDEARLEMDLLRKRWRVEILNLQCDVSVRQQVEDAISRSQHRFSPRPIRGVFHSAAVLHDALMENLDQLLIRKVLQPKIAGALNIHYATLSMELDWFVCYSSISAFIGNASQSNYAAANSFLDAFCHYRRALGLAGQSINWGPLNLGLLLNKEHFQKFLQAKGMMIMDVCEVHEALRDCLLGNRPQQVVCKFNFKNLNLHVLSQNASLRERLSALVETELLGDRGDERGFPQPSPAHESVKKMVSDVSNVSAAELEEDSTLWALGIDSMLAMTLQNKIFQEVGVNVPLVRLLDPNTTLASLSAYVRNNGDDSPDASHAE